MNRTAFALAFAIGLLAVFWVGAGFVGSSALALAMTVAIAAAYLLGAWELHRFRAATGALAAEIAALTQPPQTLATWLDRLPASLRQTVRLRLEGERTALPGPALTPYLVGLLVMLGMLGTFLGLILTFKGAVFAVEGSADLRAVRSALAAPIEGLGLAFGTSVAGVAASAALGLMSALSRRQRLDAGRLLDAAIASVLRPFSGARQREETLEAFQAQAQALPALVERVGALMDGLERRSQELDRQLLERQEQFHREASAAYSGLADSVGGALRESLATAARQAGESLRPVVETAMTGIAQESRLVHERQVEATRAELQALSSELGAAERERLEAWTRSLEATVAGLRDEWDRLGARNQAGHEATAATLERTAQAGAAALERTALATLTALEQATQASAASLDRSAQTIAERGNEQSAQMLAELGRLLAASEELVRARTATEAQWAQAHQERMNAMTGMLRSELGALRDDEAARGQAAVQRLADLQTAMAGRLEALQAATAGQLTELQSAAAAHLASLGATLEAPMTRLIETASEAPRAAAEVIAQLRQEMSRLAERDTHSLEQQASLISETTTLLDGLRQATRAQRDAIESLVSSADAMLDGAGGRFSQVIDVQAGSAAEATDRLAVSTAELASLGESFGRGVELFGAGNQRLVEGLERVESAISRSIARSDEQLEYYVAQAREVIELSIGAQQGILEDLRRLRDPQGAAAGDAA